MKERRRREKLSNSCALSFDNGYFNWREFLTEKTVSFKLNFLFDRWEKKLKKGLGFTEARTLNIGLAYG